MNFIEALEYLKIEEYAERIFNSNSRGELSHLQDYINLAEHCKVNNKYCNTEEIKKMFIYAVNNFSDAFLQHFPFIIKTDIESSVFYSRMIDSIRL